MFGHGTYETALDGNAIFVQMITESTLRQFVKHF
jgi:hypothetical protein